jgi:hypothetical protein
MGGVRGQRHALAAFIPGKDLVPIVQEAGWAPGPVWTGAENLAPTAFRSLDRPDHSESLDQLCYPTQLQCTQFIYIFISILSIPWSELRIFDVLKYFFIPAKAQDAYKKHNLQ